MSRPATSVERIGLFIVWPVLAPMIAIFVVLAVVLVWPYILFGRHVRIG